jgi:LysM repeat protein
MLVGEFPRTPGGSSKSKGFENPFQNNPTPCTNQHKTNANSTEPTIHKKNGRKMKKLKKM